MSKNTVINIVLVLILLGCIYAIWRLFKQAKNTPILKGAKSESNDLKCKGSLTMKELRLFDRSCEVKQLQCELNHYYNSNLITDGYLGYDTLKVMFKNGINVPITLNKFKQIVKDDGLLPVGFDDEVISCG